MYDSTNGYGNFSPTKHYHKEHIRLRRSSLSIQTPGGELNKKESSTELIIGTIGEPQYYSTEKKAECLGA